MTLKYRVWLIEGLLILISIAFGQQVNPYWHWLAVLIGVNLLQSGFTNRCLLEGIARKLGWGGAPDDSGEPGGYRAR